MECPSSIKAARTFGSPPSTLKDEGHFFMCLGNVFFKYDTSFVFLCNILISCFSIMMCQLSSLASALPWHCTLACMDGGYTHSASTVLGIKVS